MAADPPEEAAFEKFVARRKVDLERIRRSTRNEHELADVINEARLMASELRARNGVAVDFLEESFQDLLISHLYQYLVRYTEQNIRHATRLSERYASDSRFASDVTASNAGALRIYSHYE